MYDSLFNLDFKPWISGQFINENLNIIGQSVHTMFNSYSKLQFNLMCTNWLSPVYELDIFVFKFY